MVALLGVCHRCTDFIDCCIVALRLGLLVTNARIFLGGLSGLYFMARLAELCSSCSVLYEVVFYYFNPLGVISYSVLKFIFQVKIKIN